jgi:hypothetical protein
VKLNKPVSSQTLEWQLVHIRCHGGWDYFYANSGIRMVTRAVDSQSKVVFKTLHYNPPSKPALVLEFGGQVEVNLLVVLLIIIPKKYAF